MSITYYTLGPPYREFVALRGDLAGKRLQPGVLIALRRSHDEASDHLSAHVYTFA